MTQPAPSSATLGDRFVQVITDPAALELLLFIGLTLILLFVFRRLGRVARELSKRRELREYIRGMSHLVNGEYAAAARDLKRVVDRDPEHTEARIALGDAHWALGEAPEAHRHHYHVEEVYGKSSPRVSLCLARDLVTLDRREEAVEHLQRSLLGEVEGDASRALLIENLIALDREEEAIPLVKASGGDTAPLLGRLHAAAGFRALGEGRDREGVRHLQRAIDQHPGLLAPRMALVGRRWVAGDAEGAWSAFRAQLTKVRQLAATGTVLETGAPPEGLQRVFERAKDRGETAGPALPPGGASRPALGEGGSAGASPPAARDASAVMELGDESAAPDLPPKDLGEMLEAVMEHRAGYVCRVCGEAASEHAHACPACATFDGLEAVGPGRARSGREIAEVVDEIEENRYFIGRLVEQVVRGDRAAEARLLRLGEKAIPEVFQRMMEVGDNRPLIALLVRLGPDHLDAMAGAYLHMRAFGSRNILREGLSIFRSFGGILEEVLGAMGDDAVPWLRAAVNHADESMRKIAVGGLVRLGRGDVIGELVDAVPRSDLIGRLNEASDEAVGRLLRLAAPEGRLVRDVLADRTFRGEATLVAALDDPETGPAAEHAVTARGFSPVIAEGLVARLGGPYGETAARLLHGMLGDAHDHLVCAFTRAGLTAHRRAALEPLLTEDPPRTAARVLEEMPLAEPDLMAGVHALFGRLGDAALPAIEARYGRSESLNVLGIDLGIKLKRERGGRLKEDLIRLAAAVGGEGARQLLRRIEGDEPDADLRELCRELRARRGEADA